MQLKRNKEMEFETLKKSNKKQIIIGALAVCVIGGALTFATSRAFYKVDGSIDLAKGTVNYKPYDFKIMAMYQQKNDVTCTEDNCYNEITDRMPTSGYVINEDKSYCTIDNKNHDTSAVLKTIDGHHIIENLKKSDKCYLYFDKKKSTASETIIANLGTSIKMATPDFSKTAISDEGVYSVNDSIYEGTSYYWRGAVINNYVKFANLCWRIVRINGDKSIRLIYDGSTCHANGTNTTESIAKTSIYNANYDQSNYVGWTYEGQLQRPTNNTSATSSNAKTQLESWLSSNINGTNTTKVADGKFCNDRNAASGYSWEIIPKIQFYYAAYKRLYIDYQPTLACNSEDVYTLKVGLITADEIAFAGGKYDTYNNKYYLYNAQNYWTMSPFEWYISNPRAGVFRVNYEGAITKNFVPNSDGLRPVINLKSDITFQSGGDGTLNNPYVVE